MISRLGTIASFMNEYMHVYIRVYMWGFVWRERDYVALTIVILIKHVTVFCEILCKKPSVHAKYVCSRFC